MPRFLPLVPLFLAAFAATAAAQPYGYPSVGGQPKSGFTAAVRLLGSTSVTFRDVGTIPSPNDPSDMVSEVNRGYDDGFVGRDARTTDDGVDIPDDGKTNTWGFGYDSQVVGDGTAIAFHNYETINNGSTVKSDSSATMGVDLEASLRFGGFGKSPQLRFNTVTWGGMAGFAFNSINASTRSTITANLRTLTDLYSLDGATPPAAGYSAPSSTNVVVNNPDGTTTTNTVDSTTFLANRPYSRTPNGGTITPDGAEIDGYWQVKGAYFTLRAGPWIRWQPARRISFRAAVGATFTLLGLEMRYDEIFQRDDMVNMHREAVKSPSTPISVVGAFGSLDMEFWLTERTGIFAGAMYEKVSKKTALSAGGRSADIDVSNGAGFRFGITTRF